MTVAENKAVISSFFEKVPNQGRLERVDDLVAVDFVEVEPIPGQQQRCEGLKQVVSPKISRARAPMRFSRSRAALGAAPEEIGFKQTETECLGLRRFVSNAR